MKLVKGPGILTQSRTATLTRKQIPVNDIQFYVVKSKAGGNTYLEVPMQNSDWVYYNELRSKFNSKLFSRAAK